MNFRERLVELRFFSCLAMDLWCSSSLSLSLFSLEEKVRSMESLEARSVDPPERASGSVSPARSAK